jgi:hypothetical protein
LGLSPTPLASGIERTVSWYRERERAKNLK